MHCHSGPARARGLRRGQRLDERLRLRDDLLHRAAAVVHAAHRRVRALPDAEDGGHRSRELLGRRPAVARRHDGDARARHAQDGRTRAASSRCCRASTSTATCKIGSSNTRRRELGRRYEIGVGNIMWGNDFPHPEGTWPYTREFLKDRFWDIPIDETEQILGLNQAEFYGFDLDKLQPIADRIGPDPRGPRPDRRVGVRQVGAVQEGRAARGSPARKPARSSPTSDAIATKQEFDMSAEPLDPGARARGTARRSCRSRPTCGSRSRTSPIPRSTRRCCRRRSPRRPSPACACTSPASRSTGKLHEIVSSFLLDAMYGDQLGQFCAVMPIDLETAVTPSRETYGEPKKLAQLECEREGDHVTRERHAPGRHDHRGRRRRHRASSPVPAPYAVRAVLVQVPARGVG